MTTPTKERLAELREWLESLPRDRWSLCDNQTVYALFSVLDNYELQDALIAHLQEGIKELNRVRAELERARPLIEAVEKAELRACRYPTPGWTLQAEMFILRAALDLKAKMEGRKP
jgi:hypothetical protein